VLRFSVTVMPSILPALSNAQVTKIDPATDSPHRTMKATMATGRLPAPPAGRLWTWVRNHERQDPVRASNVADLQPIGATIGRHGAILNTMIPFPCPAPERRSRPTPGLSFVGTDR
jgi:hypothetical protein